MSGRQVTVIQDENGRGPFRPGIQRSWADADHDKRNRAFFDEFGWKICRSIRENEFAFSSASRWQRF